MQFDITKPAVPEPGTYTPAFSIKRAVSLHVFRLVVVMCVAAVTLKMFRLFVSSFMGI